MKTPITVLLSDDHNIVREGLRLVLATASDIKVVGEVGNGWRAVGEAKRLLPDVVLLDLSMPQLNGIEAARQIVKEAPSVRVLILSAYSEDHYVQHAVEAGAAGYLMKETAGNDLLQAVREVAKGNAFFSPPVAKRLLNHCQDRFRTGSPIKARPSQLTSRQAQILQLLAEGRTNKEMAGLMSLSIKTVEKHRQDLMDKLNIHNIAMLTRYAVSSGVVDSNRVPNESATPAAGDALPEKSEKKLNINWPPPTIRPRPTVPSNPQP